MSSPPRRHRSRSRSKNNRYYRSDQRTSESKRSYRDSTDRDKDRKRSRSRSHRHRSDPPSSSRRAKSPEKGSRMGMHPIPSSVNTSDQCWDTNEVYGLTLPRFVATTPWTTKQGIAGKAIETLPIIDATYDNANSYGLRLLASGRYTSLEFSRSYKESCLLQHILQLLRARQEGNRAAR